MPGVGPGPGHKDGIYNYGRSSCGYRLYPNEKVLNRNFEKELIEIEFEKPQEITILTLFCGRFHCLIPYFWSLGNLDYDKKKIHLLFYCTTPIKIFYNLLNKAIKKIASEYASVKLVWDTSNPPSRLAFSEKDEDVELHLDNIPKIYNRAIRHAKTRYLFTFEDDQMNPSHIIKRHLRTIKLKNVASSCGVAFDRHHTNLPVAFDFYLEGDGQIKGIFADRKFRISPVGSGGLGSTIIDMDKMKDIDFTHRLNEVPDLLGSDVCLGYELNKRGHVILYDWDIHSFHMNSKGGLL